MGASTIAIRPLYIQDFQAKVGSGRLFDMGGSTVTVHVYHACMHGVGDGGTIRDPFTNAQVDV